MNSLIRYIMLVLTSLAATIPASALSAAQRADSAYNEENFRQAAQLYTDALKESGPNATIYYNLGNSYYRLGKTGLAIVNYERALRVNPSFDDARTNRDFVLSRVDNLPEDDSTFLSNLHQSIIAWTTPTVWAWTAAALFILLLAMAGMYIFGNGIMLRKTGFFGGIIVLALTVYIMVVAYGAASAQSDHSHAVVTVPVTNLNTVPRTPKNSSDKIIPMPEGARLQIIDSLATPGDPQAGKWYDVKINNTSRAWVNAAHVERI
ncbi:MAG: tetratricopeptide repeat protein [Muribaculaceae bacterium]|nr:tetratricopeptide repeat protein [Muribaculaceae bacterium]